MIEIYDKSNLNFKANGDITLEPISCTYKSELNGAKELTLEHPLDDLERWKYIKEDNLIAVSRNGKKQFYRIYNKVKSLDSITAYARPLFYDLIDTVLLDVRPTNSNGQQALSIILANTKFKAYSNITKVNTAYYVRKNVVEAITSNDENSFFNRWGGEIYLDNYDIYINDKIGTDKGVRVEFGYNLNAIEEDVNLDNVATRIIPTGFDGIMLSGNAPWVDSPNINKYVNIKTRVINFEDVKVKENPEDEEGFNTLIEAQAELRRRCVELYNGGIDKPTVNYKIDMVDLSETTAYKEYKELEDIDEGDTVTCYVKSLDIEVQARCISLERDELTGKLISFELGNFISNYFNSQIDIINRVDSILGDLDSKLNDAITPGGAIRAEKIKGFIDGTKTKLKASREVAQKQEQRVIEFEDLDPNSPTYGSTILGTQGIFVSDSKTTSDEWNYTAALTAKGLVANLLYGKILAGTGAYFDIEKGEIYFNKGLIQGKNSLWDLNTGEIKSALPDGSKIVISPTDGFYNMFGTSKREYHHLNYSTTFVMPSLGGSGSGYSSKWITLPEEFKGKIISASVSIAEAKANYVPSTFGVIGNIGAYVQEIDKVNGKVLIYGFLNAYDINNKTWHNLNERLTVNLTVIA
ncbi:MAG: phage tail spike protein [Clostridium sp.]